MRRLSFISAIVLSIGLTSMASPALRVPEDPAIKESFQKATVIDQNIDQAVASMETLFVDSSRATIGGSDRFGHKAFFVFVAPDEYSYSAPTTVEMLSMNFKSKYFERLISVEKYWVPVIIYS